jgi:hypothetical protein
MSEPKFCPVNVYVDGRSAVEEEIGRSVVRLYDSIENCTVPL